MREHLANRRADLFGPLDTRCFDAERVGNPGEVDDRVDQVERRREFVLLDAAFALGSGAPPGPP